MGGEVFRTLLSSLTCVADGLPDPRRGANTRYRMRDAVLSAFGVFHCQDPSFLAHQQRMQLNRGMNNAATVFGVEILPTDNQIRNLLDPVDPKQLRAVFGYTFEYLQQ